MLPASRKGALTIAAIYSSVAALWIFFSDRLVAMLARDANQIVQLSTYKGWAFVAVTASLLYVLTKRYLSIIEKENHKLQQSSFELTAAYEELTAIEEELRDNLTTLEKNHQLLQLQEEELRRKNDYLDALVGISLSVSRHMDLATLLHTIADRALLLSHATSTFVYLVDPAGDALEMHEANGHARPFIGLRLRIGEGLAGKVLLEKRAKFINDYTTWPHKVSSMDMSVFGSIACVPILVEDQVIAILGLSYATDSGLSFNAETLSILERFASVAALSLNNTMLYEALQQELAQSKAHEEKIYHLAYHDATTGLFNRNYIKERLDTLLPTTANLPLYFLDMDGFKLVNDIAGHEVGDQVLTLLGQRLQTCAADCLIASMGADKFIVFDQRKTRSVEEIEHLAEDLLACCREPVHIEGHDFFLTASIGIAVAPHDGQDSITLMKNADMAMSQAKDSGKNIHHFYATDLTTQITDRLNLEKELRQALQDEQFLLYYQPKVDLGTCKALSVEGLVRWRHPLHGLISPGTFIPLAEETGLIVPLGTWVLRTACHQIKAWEDAGLAIPIAVNLSARQFYRADLLETIAEILAETGAAPHLLELEITESLSLHDPEAAIATLQAIRNLGIRIAMDDFGVGQSSLVNLRRLPLDLLKIDRSFVNEAPTSAESASIVNTIIILAKTMRLRVTAEGVETPEQLTLLQRYGCDEAQGYLFAKPMPALEAEQFLRNDQLFCRVPPYGPVESSES